MPFDSIPRWVSHLTFREAMWLYAVGFALHVAEEWPGFARWVNRHGSLRFTQRDYNTIHVAGMAGAVFCAALVWIWPNPIVVFLLFSLVLTPGLLFNALFHAGATAITAEYCPGLITALTLYPSLFYVLSRTALEEGLLHGPAAIASVVIAGAFHTWEVGHNVFKAW